MLLFFNSLDFCIDEQKCELRFGSTGLSTSQVRFGLCYLSYDFANLTR